MFDVRLVIIPAEDVNLSTLEEALAGAPFFVEIDPRADGLIEIMCRGIKSTGVAAMPESLRLAQVGLSVPLKHAYPEYAARGGLLWSDVVSAEVQATI